MLFHVLPRFYGLVIAKKWAQKLAPSQSLLAAALLPPTTTVVVIIIHAAFHRWTVEVKRKAVPFLLYYILLFPSLLNDSSKVELRCDKVVSWFFKFHRNFIKCWSKKESSPLASLLLYFSLQLLNDSSKVELRCDKVVFWFFKFHRNFIECWSKKKSSQLFPLAIKWQ